MYSHSYSHSHSGSHTLLMSTCRFLFEVLLIIEGYPATGPFSSTRFYLLHLCLCIRICSCICSCISICSCAAMRCVSSLICQGLALANLCGLWQRLLPHVWLPLCVCGCHCTCLANWSTSRNPSSFFLSLKLPVSHWDIKDSVRQITPQSQQMKSRCDFHCGFKCICVTFPFIESTRISIRQIF